ncbi:MAG TPA: hypothetical protein VGF08_03225 [Terriglobales bacterium]|jgi:hypothetical protein
MAAGQVVLYFERQEDALRFTLAACSVISAGEPGPGREAITEVAEQISKASRIRTEAAMDSSQRSPI